MAKKKDLTPDKLERKREAWRRWYAKNRERMNAYYRERYYAKRAAESAAEREVRLHRQRKYYREYTADPEIREHIRAQRKKRRTLKNARASTARKGKR